MPKSVNIEISTSLAGLTQRLLGVTVAITAVALQCFWVLKASLLALTCPPIAIAIGVSAVVSVIAGASYVCLSHFGGSTQLRSILKIATIASAIPLALPILVAIPLAKYLFTRDMDMTTVNYTY
jgi:hypothetical protein